MAEGDGERFLPIGLTYKKKGTYDSGGEFGQGVPMKRFIGIFVLFAQPKPEEAVDDRPPDQS
jgi:hypothetical protein